MNFPIFAITPSMRMKRSIQLSVLLSAAGVVLAGPGIGQTTLTTDQLLGQINTITTAVPFLLISPDSRSGGMGECGVATSPDANAIHWNASKLAFSDKKMGFGVSYTPWLRALVPDINLAYLSFFAKKGKDQAIGGSLRYFSLGNITFTDVVGNTIGQYKPNEFAIDFAYSRKLGDRFAGGMAARFIHSNLTGGINVQGAATKAGTSFAVDLSGTYRNDDIKISDKKSVIMAGINISNIGSKISYSNTANKDFIPINLRLGSTLTTHMDDYNDLSFSIDINKLLVPTPPVYELDANGSPKVDPNTGEYIIAAGKDPNRSVPAGIFGSFSDAPAGFKEEMRELNFTTGMEYYYNKQFAVRAGYFYEHPTKGNRQFFTLGAGLRYNVFGLDFAYLIPTNRQRSPLENTLRFTLTFDFDAFKSQNKESGDSK
ncbi:MAG: hypothetical protein FD123_3190 [Bacteroidetes bacterium]|nr:MAG: hypothetical protein FD123_3190 [Bacteroidota bacterium]